MEFFDLNVPYEKPSPGIGTTSIEANRTKIAVKAMELGYTGIAYNRTVDGVLSDKLRCSIKPLSIFSLLNILPSLPLSAKLHRDLLRIPLSTPFHQYTRITVCVDNPFQINAAYCDNPILKTYDLVAIKPSNQITFDMACQRSEVDIITIDFSKKLPFKIKQNMVKAAVERGVCFEVSYSGVLTDAEIRRPWIYGAKCLMEWTRRRNVIISSGAPSVNDLRGPCDVANLLSLLGLSKEQAKDAISKNCRNLLVKALRKRRFYKSAIRVEPLSITATSNSEEDLRKELLKWDPLSSEGGIPLNDSAKRFSSSSSEASKKAKSIDFASLVGSMSFHGFQVKDFLPANNASTVIPDGEKVSQSTPAINNSTEQPIRQGESLVSDAMEADQVVTTTYNSNELDNPTCARELEKNSTDLGVDCTTIESKAHVSQSNLGSLSITMDTLIQNEKDDQQKFLQDANCDDEQAGKLETDAVGLDEMGTEEDGSAVVTRQLQHATAKDQTVGGVSTEFNQVPVESISGRSREKRKKTPAPPFDPLKQSLNRMPFKKKGKRRSKTQQE
ncbi:protein GAMETOPHYTE DEFECTIVE 1-like [Arachis stenosperma]|uniref:protein GAMETOPHYTE DEFECTIVE 1-like n=1 Tax=Arachis stenosperma TaxID=217475 RepID=UPI0025AC8594|nr:protein GAMETOPHYTE DEFECTIVE 1-like [Arachis stenosperma]